MGHRVSILAAPLSAADGVLAALHLVRTDRPDPENRQAHSCGVLGDHVLVWRNWRAARPSGPFAEGDLARASAGGALLVLDACETTMSAVLRQFSDGRQEWSAEASDGDGKPLSTKGLVPRQIAEAAMDIRAALSAEGDPDGGDFEVPVRAFQVLTGHRYDEVNAAAFVALDSTRPAARPFWKFWG